MSQSMEERNPRIGSQSTLANLLSLSGYVGLAVGLGLESYRLYLVDSILGTGSAPSWLISSRLSLIVGSVVVLLYARVLDDLFENWLDLVILCMLIGQWGVPIWSYVDATMTGPSSPTGLFIVVSAGIYTFIAAITAINFARRWRSTTP